jgi:hypothetical protein
MAGLAWIRSDTNVNMHDKILELVGNGARGKAAGFVYWMSITYCGGHDTSGLIKKAVLPFIHGTTSDARLLVEARLWVPVDGGWKVVNYGDRNVVGMTQQVIAEGISADRSANGKKGAEARWNQ